MATQVHIEHAVTITAGGALFTENDVVVTASVHDDGEVLIDSVSFTGAPLDMEARLRGREWPVVPMTESPDPHMQRAAIWFAELLMDDEDFIGKAQAEAGLVYVGLGGNDPDGHFKQTRAA